MILAHIIAKNNKQAIEIITILMNKKLLLHAAISKKTVYDHNKAGKLQSHKQTLIIGKTKALLFDTINKELKNHFSTNMPMLYSIPIVFTDEELATILGENTAKV